MPNRPNILFIQTDQFRYDCLGAMGHPVVRTPNLDALARDGLLFGSAYAPSCPCAPARASIFTGVYPDAHGLVEGMGELDPPDSRVLPQYLRDAGYETALVGKLHLKPIDRDYGFDTFLRSDSMCTNYDPREVEDSAYVQHLRESVSPEFADYAVRRFTADEAAFEADELRFLLGTNVVDEEHHHTTWTAREAARFIEQPHDRPFFLSCSFFGPHQPYLCPGRWGTMYDPADLPLPEDSDAPLDDKPLFTHSFLAGPRAKRDARGWDADVYRRILAAYYGNISMIDHYIGEVLASLHRAGLWERTVVVFTADHGDYAGQFRSFYKSGPYEGSAHVPMIVRDPRPPPRHGQREARHVSTIDLFSTFCRVAGLSPPTSVESRDLSPLLHDPSAQWENEARFKQRDWSAIVRDGLKLCRGDVDGGTVYELYDLADMPIEKVNRAGDAAYAARMADLHARLGAWHAKQQAK